MFVLSYFHIVYALFAIPNATEELLVEDAIAEYLARMGEKLNPRNNKRAYPYYPLRAALDEEENSPPDENLTEAEAEAFLEALVDAAAKAEGILPPVPQVEPEEAELTALEDALRPKIFSPVYNTPNLFRHGVEVRHEQAQNCGRKHRN